MDHIMCPPVVLPPDHSETPDGEFFDHTLIHISSYPLFSLRVISVCIHLMGGSSLEPVFAF
jgi:hypothetical protein